MTLLAGTCTWSETTRRNGRVFALCKMQDKSLVPISRPAEDQNVRGVRMAMDLKRITLQVSNFPQGLQSIIFGLSVPEGFDLIGSTPLTMRLVLDSGAGAEKKLNVPQVTGNRYAIVAVAVRKGIKWDFGLMHEPEFYPDRRSIGRVHPNLPEWWMHAHG